MIIDSHFFGTLITRLCVSTWILVLAITLIIPFVSQATVSDFEAIQPASKIKLKKIKTKKKSSSFFLEAFETYYLSSDKLYYSSSNANQSHSNLGLGVDGLWGKKHQLRAQVRGFFSFSENKNYLNTKNFYYKFNFEGKRTNISIGRRVHKWSLAEDVWTSGLWQPRDITSPLNTSVEGLTGLQFEHIQPLKKGSISFNAFYSSLYIPEQPPQFDIEEGKFVSNNPWFPQPPEKLIIFNQEKGIYFDLNKPGIEETVQQTSKAVQLNYKSKNFYAGTSWAQKPINTLFIRLDYSERASSNTVDVTVNPVVLSHTLESYHAGFNFGSVNIWQNLTKETPQIDTPGFQQISQMADPSTHHTSYISYSTDWKTEFYMSYHNVLGGQTLDYGENARLDESVFDPRFQYFNAYKIGFKNLKLGRLLKHKLNMQVSYDGLQRAGVLGTQYSYSISSHFNVNLDGALIGLVDENESEINKSFLRKFRANDYLKMGFTYVF